MNTTQIAGGALTTLTGPAQVNMHRANLYIGKHLISAENINLSIPHGRTVSYAREMNTFMFMIEGQPYPTVHLEIDACITTKAMPINVYGLSGQIENGSLNFNAKSGDVMTITENGVDISNGNVSTFNMPFGSML